MVRISGLYSATDYYNTAKDNAVKGEQGAGVKKSNSKENAAQTYAPRLSSKA